jgi:phosphate transport system substrate-binding protein
MKFRIFLTAVLAAAAFLGCDQKPGSTETQTAGRIVVAGSDGAVKMMRRQSQRFMALYPKSDIVVVGGGSKAGIVALNEGRARIAVVSRDLTAEEDSIIRLNGGKAKGYKIAHDGLALIVNSGSAVRQLTFDQLERIFTGKVSGWAFAGGSLGMLAVIPGPNLGSCEYFQKIVMRGAPYSQKAYPCSTNAQIVETVKKYPGAIGFVPMSFLYSDWDVWPPVKEKGVKAVAVGLVKESGFYMPNQKTVNEGNYPLTHPLYLYVNETLEKTFVGGRYSLAHGFITFVSSTEGQQILAKQGLVPSTVPVLIKQ